MEMAPPRDSLVLVKTHENGYRAGWVGKSFPEGRFWFHPIDQEASVGLYDQSEIREYLLWAPSSS